MPTLDPQVKPRIPTWLDPANASVFDSTPIAALRKVAKVAGVEDEVGNIMGAATGGMGMAASPSPKTMDYAVLALRDLLQGDPEAVNPLKVLATSKATGKVPPPTTLPTPTGFVGGEATLARDPDLALRHLQEQEFFRAPTAATRPLLGRQVSGTPPKNAKVTPDIVREIRAKVSGGVDLPTLKGDYPTLAEPTLRQIITGDSWAGVK